MTGLAARGGTRGMMWLFKRETLRVGKLWTQTVLAPIVASALFIVVFGFSLSGRIRHIDGFPYREFIVPGLITMAMVQAAYSNNSSSVFQARSDRYINDVLSAPMHAWQMNIGYQVGGIVRSVAIGLGLGAIAVPITGTPIREPIVLVAAIGLGLLLFAALGTVVGIGVALLAAALPVTGAPIREPLELAVAVVLALTLFSSLGVVVGIYAETFDHHMFVNNILILPLVFVGGVFYSVARLPSPWHELSHVNPLFYLVSAVRYGFLGHADVSVLLALGVTAALAIPVYLWSQWLFTTGRRLKA